MSFIYNNTEKKLKAESGIYRQTVKLLKNVGNNNALSKELNNQLKESLKSQELYKRVLSNHSRTDRVDWERRPVFTVPELLNEQLRQCQNIRKRLEKSLNYELPYLERLECFYKRRKLKQLSIFLKDLIKRTECNFLKSLTIPRHPINKYSEKVFIRIIGCEKLHRSFSFESIIAGLPDVLKRSVTDDIFGNDANNTNAQVKCDLVINNHVLFTTVTRKPSQHCWNQSFEYLHDFGQFLELHVTWVSPYPRLNAVIRKTAVHYEQLDFILAGFTYITFDEDADRGFFSRVIELYPSGKVFLEVIIKPKSNRSSANQSRMSKSMSRSLNSLAYATVQNHQSLFSFSNLKLLALLGTGHFGKIILCEHMSSKETFALKALRKSSILEQNDHAQVLEEKRVLQISTECNYPFLLHLFACFQNKKYIMFLLDFVEAGDLATLMHEMKSFTAKQTRFYAAIIVLCIEFLHSKNIMYRDLKLENLLLDKQGYLKLVDFGLSKTNMRESSRTRTFCGTVDYMAPEILVDDSYSRMIDWWAIGVLVYYMITGQLPFDEETDMETLNAIITKPVKVPSTVDGSLSSFILSLLDKNPGSRLGSQNGAKDVKSHYYFQEISFSKIFSRKIYPPFVPDLKHPLDLSYFDSQFTRKKPTLDSAESVTPNACDESFFKNFCL